MAIRFPLLRSLCDPGLARIASCGRRQVILLATVVMLAAGTAVPSAVTAADAAPLGSERISGSARAVRMLHRSLTGSAASVGSSEDLVSKTADPKTALGVVRQMSGPVWEFGASFDVTAESGEPRAVWQVRDDGGRAILVDVQRDSSRWFIDKIVGLDPLAFVEPDGPLFDWSPEAATANSEDGIQAVIAFWIKSQLSAAGGAEFEDSYRAHFVEERSEGALAFARLIWGSLRPPRLARKGEVDGAVSLSVQTRQSFTRLDGDVELRPTTVESGVKWRILGWKPLPSRRALRAPEDALREKLGSLAKQIISADDSVAAAVNVVALGAPSLRAFRGSTRPFNLVDVGSPSSWKDIRVGPMSVVEEWDQEVFIVKIEKQGGDGKGDELEFVSTGGSLAFRTLRSRRERLGWWVPLVWRAGAR